MTILSEEDKDNKERSLVRKSGSIFSDTKLMQHKMGVLYAGASGRGLGEKGVVSVCEQYPTIENSVEERESK